MTLTSGRHILGACLVGLAFAACADATPAESGGTRLEVTLAPLTLPGATDVCYSLAVVNADDEVVLTRGPAATLGDPTRNPAVTSWLNAASLQSSAPICSTQFGNGPGGSWSYVAPCDADAPDHTVTLWLESIEVATGPSPLSPGTDYQDPCPTGCSIVATCAENADTPVTFNITVMREANQGFFDVGVNFDNVFCSAKLDTCYGADFDTDAIRLLPGDTGERLHTAVVAVACSAGAGDAGNTVLHMSDLVVTCGSTSHTLNLADVVGEGNLSAPNPTLGDLDATVHFGTEQLPGVNKVFTTVAFALPPGETCDVLWTVVPSKDDTGPQPSVGDPGQFTQPAGIQFVASGNTVAHGVCDRYSLDGVGPGAGDGVVSEYFQAPIDYSSKLSTSMPWFRPTSRLAQDLFATYNFDGDFNDAHGTRNLAAQNGASFSEGKINQAFLGDGVNDHLTFPNNDFEPPSSFSVNCWVRYSGTGTYTIATQVSANGYLGYRVFIQSNNAVFRTFYSGLNSYQLATTGAPLSSNAWHMLTFVHDATSGMKIYVNGNVSASNTSYSAIQWGDTTINRLGLNWDGGTAFSGGIDMFSQWTRALTADEVMELFASGNGRQYPF